LELFENHSDNNCATYRGTEKLRNYQQQQYWSLHTHTHTHTQTHTHTHTHSTESANVNYKTYFTIAVVLHVAQIINTEHQQHYIT